MEFIINLNIIIMNRIVKKVKSEEVLSPQEEWWLVTHDMRGTLIEYCQKRLLSDDTIIKIIKSKDIAPWTLLLECCETLPERYQVMLVKSNNEVKFRLYLRGFKLCKEAQKAMFLLPDATLLAIYVRSGQKLDCDALLVNADTLVVKPKIYRDCVAVYIDKYELSEQAEMSLVRYDRVLAKRYIRIHRYLCRAAQLELLKPEKGYISLFACYMDNGGKLEEDVELDMVAMGNYPLFKHYVRRRMLHDKSVMFLIKEKNLSFLRIYFNKLS
ncbi:MAG: hypothetical protein J6T72_04605 [Alphaproteobacteria bacterium]|nr:hypothetical protein [Alphaproteobacteria bacterium]